MLVAAALLIYGILRITKITKITKERVELNGYINKTDDTKKRQERLHAVPTLPRVPKKKEKKKETNAGTTEVVVDVSALVLTLRVVMTRRVRHVQQYVSRLAAPVRAEELQHQQNPCLQSHGGVDKEGDTHVGGMKKQECAAPDQGERHGLLPTHAARQGRTEVQHRWSHCTVAGQRARKSVLPYYE